MGYSANYTYQGALPTAGRVEPENHNDDIRTGA